MIARGYKMKQKRHHKKSPFSRGLAAITVAAALSGGYFALRPSSNLSRHGHHPLMEIMPEYFLVQYKDALRKNAGRYDLPPELIGAIILVENRYRRSIDDIGELVKEKLSLNPSLGPGQVKKQLAKSLGSYENYGERLKDPTHNLEYVARFLGYLRDRYVSSISGSQLLKQPRDVALLGTLFNRGEQIGKDGKVRQDLSCYGFSVLEEMASLSLDKDPLEAVRFPPQSPWRTTVREYVKKQKDVLESVCRE